MVDVPLRIRFVLLANFLLHGACTHPINTIDPSCERDATHAHLALVCLQHRLGPMRTHSGHRAATATHPSSTPSPESTTPLPYSRLEHFLGMSGYSMLPLLLLQQALESATRPAN